MRGCSRRTSDDGFGYHFLIGTAILVAVALLPSGARGQTELQCGVPVQRFLAEGASHEYRFEPPAGARVVIDVTTDVSGNIGFIKKEVSRVGGEETIRETCVGPSIDFVSPGGALQIELSDCVDEAGVTEQGTYTITFHIVSGEGGNCALPLSCGATPDGVDLEFEGGSDAYSFVGTLGRQVRLSVNELDGSGNRLGLRVFDPDGRTVPSGVECGSPVTLVPASAGLYTVLVSDCERPLWTGLYRVSYYEPDCPAGPEITYFGVASSQAFPRLPDDRDGMNRPVYIDDQGFNILLVVEGREGSDGRTVGLTTLGDPLPDLQMLVSRDLGNGDPTVCDVGQPEPGGIAATPDLVFSDDADVADAVNDLGCRFDDGQGNPSGRDLSLEACTRSMRDFGFGFVDPTTTAQFCAEVTQSWGFPPGDTIVAARLRDRSGEVGARREIVVRVPGETFTPTPTPTPTLSGTRTPTPTRGAIECVGDCNRDGIVDVDELITGIGIALGRLPAHYCWNIDADEDGTVSVAELVDGVTNALDDCAGS